MLDYSKLLSFYKGKKVLITGNTGFKGSWLSYLLISAGADVTGYALKPESDLSMFNLICLDKEKAINQIYGDIRDTERVINCFGEVRPEIVIHMAAQPIVRESYKNPVYTYGTNVMGTVNVCEAVRRTEAVRSFLNVTTDKVYKNREWDRGYKEDDELDGADPYSNSKSCSELVTHSYKKSFFDNLNNVKNSPRVSVSTARAGNVIGGGDFSMDRIIPDCVRAIMSEGVINVRNPHSTRPYQHVLEPLFAYLTIMAKQYDNSAYAGYYNVGPEDSDCITTGDLVTCFCEKWNGNNDLLNASTKCLSWVNKAEINAPHEANFLKLDCSKLKAVFDWQPRWNIEEAISETVAWTRVWLDSTDEHAIRAEMAHEIEKYIGNEI